MTDRWFAQAEAQLEELAPETLTEVLPELNAYGDEIEATAIQAVDAGDTEPEEVLIGLRRAELDQILITTFVMGALYADSHQEVSDIVVGISPEQAADITRGLFGPGATLTLAVVRGED